MKGDFEATTSLTFAHLNHKGINGILAGNSFIHGGESFFFNSFTADCISHASLKPGGAAPVAPSAIKPEGEAMTYEGIRPFVEPRALKAEEIPAIKEQFRRGAENGREAGFDGVELHAASGYLLDQFLRHGSNQRTDQHGGSLENPARLLFEVTEAVVSVLGDGDAPLNYPDPATFYGGNERGYTDYPFLSSAK